jgi:hypothetical protein
MRRDGPRRLRGLSEGKSMLGGSTGQGFVLPRIANDAAVSIVRFS